MGRPDPRDQLVTAMLEDTCSALTSALHHVFMAGSVGLGIFQQPPPNTDSGCRPLGDGQPSSSCPDHSPARSPPPCPQPTLHPRPSRQTGPAPGTPPAPAPTAPSYMSPQLPCSRSRPSLHCRPPWSVSTVSTGSGTAGPGRALRGERELGLAARERRAGAAGLRACCGGGAGGVCSVAFSGGGGSLSPQAGQKRKAGSTPRPHCGQNRLGLRAQRGQPSATARAPPGHPAPHPAPAAPPPRGGAGPFGPRLLRHRPLRIWLWLRPRRSPPPAGPPPAARHAREPPPHLPPDPRTRRHRPSLAQARTHPPPLQVRLRPRMRRSPRCARWPRQGERRPGRFRGRPGMVPLRAGRAAAPEGGQVNGRAALGKPRPERGKEPPRRSGLPEAGAGPVPSASLWSLLFKQRQRAT